MFGPRYVLQSMMSSLLFHFSSCLVAAMPCMSVLSLVVLPWRTLFTCSSFSGTLMSWRAGSMKRWRQPQMKLTRSFIREFETHPHIIFIAISLPLTKLCIMPTGPFQPAGQGAKTPGFWGWAVSQSKPHWCSPKVWAGAAGRKALCLLWGGESHGGGQLSVEETSGSNRAQRYCLYNCLGQVSIKKKIMWG